MANLRVAEQQELPAGEFSTWLHSTRNVQAGTDGADVPCGACNACCKSAYFIHIGPDETDTLARIPEQLLFAAPGLPAGNVLMGYDEHGHCPMLIDESCSIYAHRPTTCRRYDCRVFPAAGIAAGEDDKRLISQRTRRWKFSFPAQRDRDQHSAVQAAAKFLHERAGLFPNGVPRTSTQLAILAIKVYEVFLGPRHASDQGVAEAVMEANEKFEARTPTA